MKPLLAALPLLCAAAAQAQVLRAPALGRSVLPGLGALSAVPSGLTAPAQPALALAPAAAPVLTVTALPAALPAPAAAAPAAAPRAVLEAVSVPLAGAAGNPAAQAPVLSGLFEGRRVSIPDVVPAGASLSAPTRLAPAVNLAAEETPAPPAPRPVWKTAGLYALRAAGFLGAAYGGLRIGDMAYLGAQFLGPWGVVLSLPLLGGAAWWLGRRKDASPLGRSIMGGLFLSAGFVVIGQQAWDLFHSPFGLFVGIPVGVVLALLASGRLGGKPESLDTPQLRR